MLNKIAITASLALAALMTGLVGLVAVTFAFYFTFVYLGVHPAGSAAMAGLIDFAFAAGFILVLASSADKPEEREPSQVSAILSDATNGFLAGLNASKPVVGVDTKPRKRLFRFKKDVTDIEEVLSKRSDPRENIITFDTPKSMRGKRTSRTHIDLPSVDPS